MRRFVAVGGAVVLIFGACGGGDTAGNEAFCDATREVIEMGDLEEYPPEMDVMVEEAPDEVRDSVEYVAETFAYMFENQDPSVLEDPEFEAASEDLREYAVENCEGVTDETK